MSNATCMDSSAKMPQLLRGDTASEPQGKKPLMIPDFVTFFTLQCGGREKGAGFRRSVPPTAQDHEVIQAETGGCDASAVDQRQCRVNWLGVATLMSQGGDLDATGLLRYSKYFSRLGDLAQTHTC